MRLLRYPGLLLNCCYAVSKVSRVVVMVLLCGYWVPRVSVKVLLCGC